MIKLVGVLIIFAFFLLIIGAKTIFGGTKRCWQKAKILAEQNSEGSNVDPEFDEKNLHLKIFLQAQELLLSLGRNKPYFANDREKLRYLHFVCGAIDQLSRTIKDEERAESWAMTTFMVQASLLFGFNDAMKYIESYGRSGDAELHRAGERGWQAMRTYILGAVGKASQDDFQKSCTELYAVVRGKE